MPRSFTVVIDTKEKQPWELLDSQVLGCEYRSLKTGDYTVEGLEDQLCIERKKSVNELATNIHQARFKRELERMESFRFRYLLLEASLKDVVKYPEGVDLPHKIKSKIRINGGYLIRCLNRMQVKYGFNIIYCCDRYYAQRVCLNLMKEVVNQLDAEDRNTQT